MMKKTMIIIVVMVVNHYENVLQKYRFESKMIRWDANWRVNPKHFLEDISNWFTNWNVDSSSSLVSRWKWKRGPDLGKWSLLFFVFRIVRSFCFSSVQDGIFTLGKAHTHTRSTPPLRSLPIVGVVECVCVCAIVSCGWSLCRWSCGCVHQWSGRHQSHGTQHHRQGKHRLLGYEAQASGASRWHHSFAFYLQQNSGNGRMCDPNASVPCPLSCR